MVLGLEDQMDTEGKIIGTKNVKDLFDESDFIHAYIQLPLNTKTSRYCMISLVGACFTKAYKFKTGSCRTKTKQAGRVPTCEVHQYSPGNSHE